MSSVTNTLRQIIANKKLRNKLLFVFLILALYRLLAHVPIPAVDTVRLQGIFASNQFLSLLNVFSGGTLANFSVVAVGINPYITASIIMQLAGMVFPKLKELQKDGESGREKVNQYTRLLTVPLSVVQSISVIALLNSQSLIQVSNPLAIISIVMSLMAGAMILMWLGELLSLYGVGNGISVILTAGIISQFPTSFAQVFSTTSNQQVITFLSFFLVFLMVIGLIVFMNEAVRKVQIQYAKRVRGRKVYGGQTTHLPIRVNVAGVMPIIFAISIMLVPSFAGRLLVSSGKPELVDLGAKLGVWFAQDSPIYMLVYFLIVFAFTFFSALIFFNTDDISQELKKSGAFIPGVRPGGPTKKFLEFIVTRVTLVGALFLGLIAILPSLAQIFTGLTSLAVGGTSVLIVVSVILETKKQIESMLVGQHYERFT